MSYPDLYGHCDECPDCGNVQTACSCGPSEPPHPADDPQSQPPEPEDDPFARPLTPAHLRQSAANDTLRTYFRRIIRSRDRAERRILERDRMAAVASVVLRG